MTNIIGGHEVGLLDSSLALLNRNDRSRNGAIGNGDESFVNVSNGNLLLRNRDIFMPSMGEDFALVRTYNSRAASSDAHQHDDAGWMLSTNIRLDRVNGATGEHFKITYGDGSVFDFRYDAGLDLWVSVDGAGAFETIKDLKVNGSANPAYILTRADQTEMAFDKHGRLLSSVDTNGVRMDYEYASDRLQRILDDEGHVINFVYAAGVLQKVVDENEGVLVQYKYQAGRLVEVIDRFGHSTKYSYNSLGLIDRIDLPRQQTVDGRVENYEHRSLKFEYEPINWNGPSSGREYTLTSLTDAEGGVTTFTYDFQFTTPATTQPSKNKDPLPGTTEPRLFQGGTTQVVDALGNNRAYSNDAIYREWRIANGFYQHYNAQQAGSNAALQAQVDAIRAQHKLTYTVDKFANITEVVDQEGYKTSYVYDAQENLVAVTDRNGHGAANSDSSYFRQVRAEFGLLDAGGLGKLVADLTAAEKTALADAFTTRFDYDSRGNLLSRIDNTGNKTTFTFTSFNKVASSTTAEGAALTASDEAHYQQKRIELGYAALVVDLSEGDKAALIDLYTTRYQYDAKQNLIQRTDAGGDVTRFEYDVYGNLSKRIVYLDKNDLSNPAAQQVTQYFYDIYGNNIETLDAEGNRTIRQYDHFGNLVRSVDGNGGITTYTYDADDRLLSVTDPEGYTTFNTYDAVGNRISFRDANGHLTIYVFDRNNMLVSTMDNADHGASRDRITQYSYDVVGNQTSVTDAEGRKTTYGYNSRRQMVEIISAMVANEYGANTQYSSTLAYDGEGNRIRSTNNRGFATDFLYNRDGLLIQQQDASGHTTRYTFDANRNQIMIVAGMQLPVEKRQVVRFAFDQEDQLTDQTDAEGNTTRYTYTAPGARASITDANGNTTEFDYDRNNRLVKETRPEVTDPVTGLPVRYTVLHQYDANGNKVARTDENGHTTSFAFDRDNRAVMVTDANGVQTVFSYDSRHNRTGIAIGVQAHLDADRQVVIDSSVDAQVSTFTYDEFNQLVAKTDGLGNALATNDSAQYQAMRQEMGYAALVANLSAADKNSLKAAYTDRFTFDRVGNATGATDHLNHTTSFKYDNLNRLVEQTDALNNKSTFGYDGNGNRVWQKDALSRMIAQAFDSVDRTVSVTDPLGVATVRTYDAFSNLIEQTRAAGTIDARASRFEYDLNNRLTRSIDPEGHQVSYEYDAVGNRLKVVDARGNATRYVFDALNRNVKMIDPLSFETRVEYDGVGSRISLVDARGGVRRMEYDAGNRLIQTTDAEGRVARYEYDVRGNQIKLSTAFGTADLEVTTFEYDAQNNLRATVDAEGNRATGNFDRVYNRIATTDGNGHTTVSEFDAIRRMISVTNAEGEQTTFSYDAVGNRLTQTDALGRVASMTYDDNNRVIVERAADGVETHYAYDKVGNRVSITVAANTAEAATSTFIYDLDDALVEQIDPLGHSTRYEYDENHNRTRVIDAEGHATNYLYDANNRVVSIVDALGNAVEYRYDGNGNRTQVVDARGNVSTTYFNANNEAVLAIDNEGYASEIRYDNNGNVVATTLRAIAVGLPVTPEIHPALAASAMDRTTQFAYDKLNRLTEKTDAEGFVTRFAYDAVGNRTRTELFLDLAQTRSEVTRAWYDDVNRQVALVSAEGYLTTFAYDDVGNRVGRTQYDQRVVTGGAIPLPSVGDAGRTTLYQYDSVNRLIGETSPLGVTTAHEYDKRGNRTAVIEAAGTGDQRRMEFRYDAASRMTDQIDAHGTVTRFELDADGNVVIRFDAYGSADQRATHFDYDAVHRVVRETDAIGVISEMAYDAAGNVTARTIAVGTPEVRTERFEYDRNNRTVAAVNGENERTEYQYDAAGNRVRMTQAPGLPEARTTQYEYDRDNRLVVSTDPVGTRNESVYDGAGNKIEAILARGVFGLERHAFYTYDLDNRLIQSVDAMGGVIRYVYDALGNQTQIIDANGGVQNNSFDVLGRMMSSVSAGGVLTQNSYDLRNNITSTTQSWADGSDARTTTYRYDLLNRQVLVTGGEGYSTSITYDKFGNQTHIQHAQYLLSPGQAGYDAAKAALAFPQSNSFVFDNANRMLSMTDAEGNLVVYAYDAVGNRISMTEAVNSAPRTTNYVYDLANRLIETRTPEGGIARNSYNEVGSKIAEDLLQSSGPGGDVWIHKTFEYDLNGRLSAEIDPYGVRTEHVYDAAGNKIVQRFAAGTADQRVIRTEYDLNNRKTADIDAENNRTDYAYDSIGNRIKVTDAIGRVVHFYYDRDNQLSTLLDPENFINTFVYDAAGNRIQERLYMTRFAGSPDDYIAPVAIESAADRITGTVYNRVNKTIAQIASDGTRHEMSYDGAGNLRQEKLFANTSEPRLRSYSYDLDNRLVHFVDVDGTVTEFTYDGANNRTSQIIYSSTDQNAVRATYISYDLNNRKIGETFDPNGLNFTQSIEYDKLGNVVRKTNGNGHSTVYAYDLNNRLTSETNALGQGTQFDYDHVGNRIAVTDARGNTTRFEFDGNNRIAKEIKPLVVSYTIAGGIVSLNPVTAMSYDAAGNEIQTIDANGHTTTRYFDGNNRLIAEINADNVLTEYAYNAAGEIAAIRLYMNRLPAAAHDPAARPAAPSGDVRLTRFEYDLAGRLVRTIHPAVQITTLIGADTNQPQAVTVTRQVEERIEYDAFGNAIETEDRNGNRSVSYYDAKGRKTAQVDVAGYLIEWDYDAQDNVIEQRLYSVALDPAAVQTSQKPGTPSGDVYVTTRRYDAGNRLIEEKAPQIAVFNPVTQTSALVRPVTLTTYDSVGNQISKVIAAGTSQALTEYSYYDAADRKIAVINANRVVHLYEYDANGNETVRKRFFNPVPASVDLSTLTAGTDFAALVQGTNDHDQTSQFAYDAINRVTREVDLMGPGAADDLSKTYRYDATANRTELTDEDGYVSRTAYDGMNRVVQTIGPDGSGTLSQTDAAGNQIYVFTGKIESQALPAANIGVTLAANLSVAWDVPSGTSLRSWVVYDTASRASAGEYAYRSAEFSNIVSGHAEAGLAAIGATVYFRVVTEDIAGNQTWSEEKSVAVPPRFHDISIKQPVAGTLEVTAHFDAGAVNPTLYYGGAQNQNNTAAFVLQGDGTYKATLTGIANPQNVHYRLGWSDAAGRSYSSAETSFASPVEHIGISSEVSQGVISNGGSTQYTMQVETRVPSSLAARLQVVQAQWRPAGSTAAYASTAVQGVESGAGYVTYTLQLGDGSPLDAGAYEVVLLGASATEEILLDRFEFTVGAGAVPQTMRSLTWTAPPAGDSQLVVIDGQLAQSERVNGRLVIDANVSGAGTHHYDIAYTQTSALAHTIDTDATAITQMLGTPPAPVVTGYNLKISAGFDAAETDRIAGNVQIAYRAMGAAVFGTPSDMTSTGPNGYAFTLDNLASGQYEVRLTYTDVDGNEVIADWLTLSANADVSLSTQSQTVLARETGGSYQVNGQGTFQVTAGLYTGPIDAGALASALSLEASATGQPAGTLAADGSTTGYFIESRFNALNARIASNEQDGLWRFYGVDGHGNAVQTSLYGTQADGQTAALDQPPVLSYSAFDARNRKIAEFGIAFTVEGESSARHPVTRTAFNVLDKAVAQTDARGNTRTSQYNAVGTLIGETDANAHSSTIQLDILGNETAATDALGHTRTKFYDQLGRMTREVDATGYETHYTYDAFDRRTTVTDGLGALTAVEGDHTTRFHYDQRDRLIQVDLAQGWHLANDRDAIYEAERERLGYTAYRDLVNQMALDARDPFEQEYDEFGQPMHPVPGAVTEAEREAARTELRAQGIDGVLDMLSAQQRAELAALYTQHAAYDGRNNRTVMTDANGHATREVYDALGRVIDTVTMQNGIEVHNRRGYDVYGNLQVEIDGDGRTTTRRYGGFARLIEETDAGGERTSYAYNRLGQQVSETSTGGKSITRQYNDAGHLTSINDVATGVASVFGYNANGQRVLERITTPGNAHNRDISYQYDAIGRQVRWADAVTGLHLNYSWDAAGNQQRVATDAGYAHAVDHSYRYDAANRITNIDHTGGAVIAEYGYDAAGNRIRYHNGTAVVGYTYDSLNRVVKGVQGATASSWIYDRVGNVMSYTGDDGKTTTYRYYENNRNWYSNGESESTMVLDLAGHTTQVTVRDGGKTFYFTTTYLADGREASVRGYGSASGNSVSTYDANHNKIAVNKGKGDGMERDETSTFVYSNEGKILFRRHDDGKKNSQAALTEYLYANGYQVGETGTDAAGANKTELDVGRYNLIQNISKDFPGTAVSMYTARDGDTLQSIAATVYGNPSLWYLIADANGLTPNDRIKAGTELKIPTSVRSGDITADTHRVYDESEIIGSTLPNLKSPPPKKKGCASFLMIIIVIIIAVVAWYAIQFLGPIIGKALGAGAAAAAGATGTAAALNLAGYAIAGAIVGAAASVVTQGFAIALGLQEKFSWKSVAAGAISGVFSGAAQGFGALAELGKLGELAQYAKVASAALRVAGAASQQLIENGKITSWSSLAAAGMQGYMETGAAEAKALTNAATTTEHFKKAAEAAKQIDNLRRVVSYVSPWVGLAETAIRNDGKLKAADWANAVGATLGTALSSGDVGTGLMSGLEPNAKFLVGNLLVGGVMSAISKSAGKDYLINVAASWAGNYIGHGIGNALFTPPQLAMQTSGGSASGGASGSGGGMLPVALDDDANDTPYDGYNAGGDDNEVQQQAALGGSTAVEAAQPFTHKVVKGNNPAQLGRDYYGDERYGAFILAYNDLDASVKGARTLQIGKELVLPDLSGLAPEQREALLSAGGQLIGRDTAVRAVEVARAEAAVQQRVEAARQQAAASAETANSNQVSAQQESARLSPDASGNVVPSPTISTKTGPTTYDKVSMGIHTALSVGGAFPVLGIVPDIVDLIYTAAEVPFGKSTWGDVGLAGVGIAATVAPGVGDGPAAALKIGNRAARMADDVNDARKTADATSTATTRGPYRGGPHSETRLPVNDKLDSHHMPDRNADPRVTANEGPAIKMDPNDHAVTSSNGQNGRAGAIYRAETADMISQGRYRDAMAREVRDVRRAAGEGSGNITKYNEAIKEMLDYARSSGQLPVNPRTGK